MTAAEDEVREGDARDHEGDCAVVDVESALSRPAKVHPRADRADHGRGNEGEGESPAAGYRELSFHHVSRAA